MWLRIFWWPLSLFLYEWNISYYQRFVDLQRNPFSECRFVIIFMRSRSNSSNFLRNTHKYTYAWVGVTFIVRKLCLWGTTKIFNPFFLIIEIIHLCKNIIQYHLIMFYSYPSSHMRKGPPIWEWKCSDTYLFVVSWSLVIAYLF